MKLMLARGGVKEHVQMRSLIAPLAESAGQSAFDVSFLTEHLR